MTHRTTTTLWTNWQPKQPTYAPERSLPERARLSICDQIDRRGGGRLGCVLERKQRPVVMHVLSVEDGLRTIIQDHPALVIPNSNDSVCPVSRFSSCTMMRRRSSARIPNSRSTTYLTIA